MCVRSIVWGGQWEGAEARGGARFPPGTFPDPPHALLPTHISLRKKSLDFVWLMTYGHHCTLQLALLIDRERTITDVYTFREPLTMH